MSERRVCLVLLVAAGVAGAAPAEQWRLTVDPESTSISFTLGATFHDVHGTAELTSGEIEVDTDTGALSGEVLIDATSADTDSEGRDKDMHNKVLESGRYPGIVWRPRQLTGDLGSGGPVEILGSIEIHGAQHDVTVSATVQLSESSWSASASLTVPYVEWGLKDPSKFVLRVDKVVEVELEAAGSLAPVAGEPVAEPE